MDIKSNSKWIKKQTAVSNSWEIYFLITAWHGVRDSITRYFLISKLRISSYELNSVLWIAALYGKRIRRNHWFGLWAESPFPLLRLRWDVSPAGRTCPDSTTLSSCSIKEATQTSIRSHRLKKAWASWVVCVKSGPCWTKICKISGSCWTFTF